MTRRLPVLPSPVLWRNTPPASTASSVPARAQREGLIRYLEGLLLPAERNKTLTALANSEAVAGVQSKEAQGLQWFLSESGWDEREVDKRRLELLFEDPTTVPDEDGVLVIDEHGDRKWGKRTAHVDRQWLANIGKTENGVVSVSSLWARRRVLAGGLRALHPSTTSVAARTTRLSAPSWRWPRDWWRRPRVGGYRFGRWLRTPSTARTAGSSISLRGWAWPTHFC